MLASQIPYKVLAEWSTHSPKLEDEQSLKHFVLKTKGHDINNLMDELSSYFGIHGDRWYWDSANDHGTMTESTVTIVFKDPDDAAFFKLMSTR